MIHGGRAEKIFAESLRTTLQDAQDVLDIGTPMRFAKELRPYENLFAGKHYIAAGYHPGMHFGPYNCDCHQDILDMTFDSDSFDAVLCIQVLEHVSDPFQAVREIHRVLRAGGTAMITVPFLVSYHGKQPRDHSPDHGSYPDFWRFTHQGLEVLFGAFRNIRITALDGPLEYRLSFLFLDPVLAWPPIRKMVDWIDRPRLGKATTRHILLAEK